MSMSMENLVGIVIGAVVIFVLVFLIANLMQLSEPEDGTVKGFQALSELIDRLKEGESDNVWLYLDKKHKIVAYDKNQQSIDQGCGAFDHTTTRPNLCNGVQACLVLSATGEYGQEGKGVNLAERFDYVEEFRVEGKIPGNTAKNPNDFSIYGKCHQSAEFDVQNIAVKREGNNVIFSIGKTATVPIKCVDQGGVLCKPNEQCVPEKVIPSIDDEDCCKDASGCRVI